MQWTDMDSGAAGGGDCGRGTELSSPGVRQSPSPLGQHESPAGFDRTKSVAQRF